ncbi:MAG TPA: non-homologous end-joining DNA ligase [Candidatus Baltobacteraceae bacterium]|nr:non-homologous end-joining DNA ligase [Candidatus Baltobacteraceae bacterium]
MARLEIPLDVDAVSLKAGGKTVALTNLGKVFFEQTGAAKRDLLQYYADVSKYLLPHIASRAMVMKRYPHGAHGEFFFMKRTPSPHPEWLQTCRIEHRSGNVIDFPMANDVASLLWIVNLGCIDLNQWYATCDDIDRPDYVHFDLDPGSAPFDRVRESALLVRDGLAGLGMKSYAKTSGSKGIHVYVPIVRGPLQKEVWTFAKSFAQAIARHEPALMTSEYKKEKRPPGRVLVDYNQNRWGSTLASVYSVRPTPLATVSAPVTWDEIEAGITIEDFRIDNMRARIADAGDLWAPLAAKRGRFDLSEYSAQDQAPAD